MASCQVGKVCQIGQITFLWRSMRRLTFDWAAHINQLSGVFWEGGANPPLPRNCKRRDTCKNVNVTGAKLWEGSMDRRSASQDTAPAATNPEGEPCSSQHHTLPSEIDLPVFCLRACQFRHFSYSCLPLLQQCFRPSNRRYCTASFTIRWARLCQTLLSIYCKPIAL